MADGDPTQGGVDDASGFASWWNFICLDQTGMSNAANCAACNIGTDRVLVWNRDGDRAAGGNGSVPLCGPCADLVVAILAGYTGPGQRWAGMPRDLAVESAVLRAHQPGQRH